MTKTHKRNIEWFFDKIVSHKKTDELKIQMKV